MGLFCGALEPMCGTLLCGENTNEEEIVGKVIGFDGAPNATPDTSIEHDEDDPRILQMGRWYGQLLDKDKVYMCIEKVAVFCFYLHLLYDWQ